MLALVKQESGRELVAEVLTSGAAISAVNWAETLTRLLDDAYPIDWLDRQLQQRRVRSLIEVRPFDVQAAREAARLRAPTRPRGLSLGDRACLALAISLGLPVLTADRAWLALPLDIEVRAIR